MFVKFVSDGSVQKAGFSATFIKELDECELKDHGCEHECHNTLGGYQCACHIGYELHSDKKSCESKWNAKLPPSDGLMHSISSCVRRNHRGDERNHNVSVLPGGVPDVEGVHLGDRCS